MKHIKTFKDFIAESNNNESINEAVKIKDDKDLISKLDKGSLPLGVTEVQWGDFKIRIKTEKNDKGKMYSMFIFDADGDTRDDIYFPQSGHDTFKTDNKNRKIAYYLISKYYKEGISESIHESREVPAITKAVNSYNSKVNKSTSKKKVDEYLEDLAHTIIYNVIGNGPTKDFKPTDDNIESVIDVLRKEYMDPSNKIQYDDEIAWLGTYMLESEDINEKKITVITYGGKKSNYTDNDIKDFIKDINIDADDLPGWLYRKGLDKYDNHKFPKTKEAVIKLLNKILNNKGNVTINVDSSNASKNDIIMESILDEAKIEVEEGNDYLVKVNDTINDYTGKKDLDIKKGDTINVHDYAGPKATSLDIIIYTKNGGSSKPFRMDIEDFKDLISNRDIILENKQIKMKYISEYNSTFKTFSEFLNESKDASDMLKESCDVWQKAQLDRELDFLKKGVDDTEDIAPDEIANIINAWIEDHTGIDMVVLKHYPETVDVKDFVTQWVMAKA